MDDSDADGSEKSVHLAALRCPAVIPFDVTRHPFRAAILDCLSIHCADGEDGGIALEQLRAPPINPDPFNRGKSSGPGQRGPSTSYIQRWLHKAPQSEANFRAVYVRFMREVVLPHIGDPQGLLFQRWPTFRCHVAGGGAPTGRRHCDADYGHQPAEINLWLPVTRTRASNSLFAESSPGAGDFEPFDLDYGQCQRFWGAMCTHYTLANDTEITRVSIDFRVVPRSCHAPDTAPPSGQQWRRVGSTRPDPDDGVELVNEALSDALRHNHNFTATQWCAFGVREVLTQDHYCMSGGFCFRPAGPRFRVGGFYDAMDAEGCVESEAKGAVDEDDEWQMDALF